jgi:UPF0176 protein
MRDLGISDVYQLEGGILKYLEQTDGTHWRGDCFVFDGRVAIDKQLLPSHPLPFGERIEERGQSGEKATSERILLPLPSGDRRKSPSREERVGERGHSCDEIVSKPASIDDPASTRPSPTPSGHPLPKGARGIKA